MKRRITHSNFNAQISKWSLTFALLAFISTLGMSQIIVSFKKPAGWAGPVGIHYFNEVLSSGTLAPSDNSAWPANLTELDCDASGFCTFIFPANVTAIDFLFVDKATSAQTANQVGITASTCFDATGVDPLNPSSMPFPDAAAEGLPALAGADLYWVFKGPDMFSSPALTAGASSTDAIGPIFNTSPYVDGTGARTYGAGPGAVGGPYGGCNTNDTSFGMNLQCPDAANATIRVQGDPAKVGWLKSDVTQGCPFVQAQLFASCGGDCDVNDPSTTENDEGIFYADYTNDCNGTKVAGENFPATSTQVRQIQLKEWTNPDPVSNASAGSLAGTEVCIGQLSRINFLDDGVGNGVGIGGDEARLLTIGGTAGATSTYDISADFNLSVNADGNFGLANEVLIASHVQDCLGCVANDAGPSNSQNAGFDWTPQGGVGYTGNRTITNPREAGETLTLDFSSTATVTIARTAGQADARATIGPGMGGKANLETEFDKWCVVELTTPLPAELTSFSAVLNERVVDVSWTTVSESNTSHFEIERSLDGQRFESIGKTLAAGNSSDVLDYTFEDNSLPSSAPVLYYRLKTVDLDNTYEYSQVGNVNMKRAKKVVAINPNPNGGKFQVFVANFRNNAQVNVFNSIGKLVYSQDIENNENRIDLDLTNQARGFYVVSVNDGFDSATTKLILD